MKLWKKVVLHPVPMNGYIPARYVRATGTCPHCLSPMDSVELLTTD